MCTYTWLFTILFLFIAITFLQSGIDKVLNFSGNKSWLDSVFKDTFLASLMPILFPLLVFQELAVGLLALVSILSMYVPIVAWVSQLCLVWAGLLFLQLFAGQRIAKDYVGATGILPYLILTILGLYFIAV
jgi:putative oxidoreductase